MWFEVENICVLGLAFLAQGNRSAVLPLLQDLFLQLPKYKTQQTIAIEWYEWLCMRVLSILDESYQNPEAFRTFCEHAHEKNPDLASYALVHWYLEPTQPEFGLIVSDGRLDDTHFQNLRFGVESSKLEPGEWTWHNQFADCSFKTDNMLEIQAANGRTLDNLNLSAPRLLRTTSDDFAIQAVCLPISDAKPAQGGILLWKDKENYFRLDRGTFGKHEITFLGCLDNHDVIIGRGRLPAERVYLRLERTGERVNALCSADGEQWFTVGHVDFPVDDPVQVGMHAIGLIDRLIYPGAYPDGTAIRFESFTIYRPSSA